MPLITIGPFGLILKNEHDKWRRLKTAGEVAGAARRSPLSHSYIRCGRLISGHGYLGYILTIETTLDGRKVRGGRRPSN